MFGEAWKKEKESRRAEAEGPDGTSEKGGDLEARNLRGNVSLPGRSYLGRGQTKGTNGGRVRRGAQGKRPRRGS